MMAYSGKLSREKTFETFENFKVLWLFAKVFSAKFGSVVSRASNLQKSSPTKVSSLARQPYFSLFPVGGARGREKYIWTLWPASRATKECNNCCRSRAWYAN